MVIKPTNIYYCSQCQKDFKQDEIVWYAWIENSCFCSKCKSGLNIKDWEPRIYKG